MKIVRQIIRGCGWLPHVGEHPGTIMLGAFVIAGALALADAGFIASLWGAGFMFVFFAPIYLWGAYDRANDSDRLEKEAVAEEAKKIHTAS